MAFIAEAMWSKSEKTTGIAPVHWIVNWNCKAVSTYKCLCACMIVGLCSAGKIVDVVSGVVALLLAVLALSAWLYVTLRHRKEKQLLIYGVITCLRASNISSDSLSASPPSQIKANLGTVSPSSITLKDDLPTGNMKRVTKEIIHGACCAAEGPSVPGLVLTVWGPSWESGMNSVRCPVMLLVLHRVSGS